MAKTSYWHYDIHHHHMLVTPLTMIVLLLMVSLWVLPRGPISNWPLSPAQCSHIWWWWMQVAKHLFIDEILNVWQHIQNGEHMMEWDDEQAQSSSSNIQVAKIHKNLSEITFTNGWNVRGPSAPLHFIHLFNSALQPYPPQPKCFGPSSSCEILQNKTRTVASWHRLWLELGRYLIAYRTSNFRSWLMKTLLAKCFRSS